MTTTQLRHLAQAYFHQDYDLDFPDPDAVICAFAEGEGRGAGQELVSEIPALLTAPVGETAIADLWINDLRAAYDPSVNGRTQREWFEHVRYLLEAKLRQV